MGTLRNSLLGLVVAGGLLAGCTSGSTSSSTDAESASYLFAISGQQGTIDGVGEDDGNEDLTLTLTGVSDHVTQFADRPIRQAYVLSTADLVDRWDDWFADAPPNAVLSFTEPDDPMPHSIVVELTDPGYDEETDTLAFTARHLHRQPDLSPHAVQQVALPQRPAPATFATATLFIDSVDVLSGTGETSPSAAVDGPDAAADTTDARPTQTADLVASPSSSPTDGPQDEPTNPSGGALGASEEADGDLGAAAPWWVGECLIQPGTNCARADLTGAELTGADLSGANLSGANLSYADLRGGSLSRAYLIVANLSYASLTGTNLSGAKLGGANLTGTNLYGANLSGAGLLNATLDKTNMSGANLSGATWIDGRICGVGSVGGYSVSSTNCQTYG